MLHDILRERGKLSDNACQESEHKILKKQKDVGSHDRSRRPLDKPCIEGLPPPTFRVVEIYRTTDSLVVNKILYIRTTVTEGARMMKDNSFGVGLAVKIVRIVVSKGKVLSSVGISAIILWLLAQMGCGQSRPLNNMAAPTYKPSALAPRCSEGWIAEKSLDACKALARQGDASAAFTVGMHYGFSKFDGRTAEEYFLMAANAGHAKAQLQLYGIYTLGIYAPRNEAKARYYLEMAANSGLSEAQYSLALSIKDKSPEKAVPWLLSAAKQGDCQAQCMLAVMYRDGNGIERNSAQALFWANLAGTQRQKPRDPFDVLGQSDCGCFGVGNELEKLLPEDVKDRAQEASSNWSPGKEVVALPAPDLPSPPEHSPAIAQQPKIPPPAAVGPRREAKPDVPRPTTPREMLEKEARVYPQEAFKWPDWKKLDQWSTANINKTPLESDELFRKINKSVWMVVSETTGSRSEINNGSFGSAVAVSQRLLLTNCHVVRNSHSIELVQGRSKIVTRVLAADEHTDRCVLTVEMDLNDFVYGFRDFKDLKVGEKVYTIGAPSGLERTLGDGIISGLRTDKSTRYIQTTAPISPGSSGGGLFDRSGNLIGITTFLVKEAQNLNFAIAVSDYLKD
jgi:serine protease Do